VNFFERPTSNDEIASLSQFINLVEYLIQNSMLDVHSFLS